MSARAAQLTDNRLLICDAILRNIAEDLDIPPGKYQEAVDRYTSVGSWLEDGDYPGTTGAPSIYVQGSFRLGTVVRPYRKGRDADYDIDLACELGSSIYESSAKAIKQMIGDPGTWHLSRNAGAGGSALLDASMQNRMESAFPDTLLRTPPSDHRWSVAA